MMAVIALWRGKVNAEMGDQRARMVPDKGKLVVVQWQDLY